MTNEWLEFQAYTNKPEFEIKNKKELSFFGKFTPNMLLHFIGFDRIFEILARGILFHDFKDNVITRDGRENIDKAKKFLCAWCSVPTEKDKIRKQSSNKSSFSELHTEFPDIVDESGAGWFYRYYHALADFIEEAINKDQLSDKIAFRKKHIKKLDCEWQKKVIQFQNDFYNTSTKADRLILFDNAIAAALDAGPLRTEEYVLTQEIEDELKSIVAKGKMLDVMKEVTRYYLANKHPDSDYVVFPIQNFCAYYSGDSFAKNYWNKLSPEFIEKKQSAYGVASAKLLLKCITDKS